MPRAYPSEGLSAKMLVSSLRRRLGSVVLVLHRGCVIFWATETAVLFRSFLSEFVDNSECQWQEWERRFRACVEEYEPEHVSIDMIKQLLMRRITTASAEEFMDSAAGVGKYRVKAACKQKVAALLMRRDSMKEFFDAYLWEESSSEHLS